MKSSDDLKLIHNNKRRIRYAAKRYNFEDTEKLCSGSKENFQSKLKVEGGFVLKQKNRIVGWGIAWEKERWKREPEFHVYILPQYRRMGFGSIIVKEAKEKYPEYLYCPHDKRSTRFFIKNNCRKSPYWSWE